MIYIAIDHIHPKTGRAMPNGIPVHQHDYIDQLDNDRLDFPRIIYYLRDCRINYQIVQPDNAPIGSLYTMVLSWFDYSQDYISLISPAALTRVKKKEMLVVFTYHEGDHPGRIRERLDSLCADHDIDPALVVNSTADVDVGLAATVNCVLLITANT